MQVHIKPFVLLYVFQFLLTLCLCRFFVLDEADGLLKQNYGDLIERLHRQMPKITNDGNRLQMIVCSATLHAFEVKKMAVCTLYDIHEISHLLTCKYLYIVSVIRKS